MDASDEHIVAGSYIGMVIVISGVKNEFDPVFAILSEKLDSAIREVLKIGALIGLSLTYAGSSRVELLELISPIILDSSNTIEL